MVIGYLYVTSNTIDARLYVGQSSKLDAESVETYLGSGDYLVQAIAEYGREAFSKKILAYFADQSELDYAEVHTIARLRAEGVELLNGGVGGPRAQNTFVDAMSRRFGVLPLLRKDWFVAVDKNPGEVKELLAAGNDLPNEDFYRELERQLLITQDLSGDCSRCGATAGAVCRTKTGNPSRNHAKRTTS